MWEMTQTYKLSNWSYLLNTTEILHIIRIIMQTLSILKYIQIFKSLGWIVEASSTSRSLYLGVFVCWGMWTFGVREPHLNFPKWDFIVSLYWCGTSKVQVGLQNEKPEVAQNLNFRFSKFILVRIETNN